MIDRPAKTQSRSAAPDDAQHQVAYVMLFIAPAFFACNMLVARAVADLIPPVALAFWRWVGAAILLAPFAAASLWRNRGAIRKEWLDILILGALGMGVCGAFVYIGAQTTTATNIGLIYSASPVLIVVLARVVYRERMSPSQGLGVALCLIGVLAIVCRGEPGILLRLRSTVGDLWILAAAIGWAVYSVMLSHRPTALDTMTRFFAICLGGVLVLLPFTVWETLTGNTVDWTWTTIGYIALVALVPAVGAYYLYAFVISRLGASRTGLIMYLIPLYNGVLAWLLLSERIEWYHLLGAALVLPGLYLANRAPSRRP